MALVASLEGVSQQFYLLHVEEPECYGELGGQSSFSPYLEKSLGSAMSYRKVSIGSTMRLTSRVHLGGSSRLILHR